MNELFAPLYEEAEADLLGVKDEVNGVAEAIRSNLGDERDRQILEELTPLQLYFLKYWSTAHHCSLLSAFRELSDASDTWRTRYENYKHALLYTIYRGKRGIRKYYSGIDTFALLAAGNIRYFLELVDQSLLAHLQQHRTLSEPVSAITQTLASQHVGRKNLAELEGLAVNGAQLTKLLLALGRIFHVMAVQLEAHTPEVNPFHIADEPVTAATAESLDMLLKSAVMHLALLRAPGNKLADLGETRDYDYMVHPIFCPFFVFTYRRKRKMPIRPADLLALVRSPKKTIRAILHSQKRVDNEPLPEQLLLFEGFYEGGPDSSSV